MNSMPDEGQIGELCAITCLSRDEAIRRLRSHNNDPNAAAGEFFDDPESTKYRWEEGAFSSDRDGCANNAGISFQVQGPDDNGRNGMMSGAPTRPPSRASNRSPLTNVVSLASEHAAADPTTKFTSEELGDEDLQRALAESVGKEYNPQEYGVIGDSKPYFGPANRSSYNNNEWAMVRGNSYAKEVLPDPEPADRKRLPDTPAFLKPSVDEHRLSAILTTLHEIPMAKEIFLNRDDSISDYGHNSHWWTGAKIESKEPNMTGSQNWADASPQDYDDFHRETQRLMAFLTGTERAYGSSDCLANLPALTVTPGTDKDSKFFELWKDICRRTKQESLIPFIFTHAVQPGRDEDAPDQEHQFAVLDLELPQTESDTDMETLYDLSDQALWAMSGMDVEASAYLDQLADVIAFRIRGRDADSRMIMIPATWYPDRYLKENREASLEMRRKKLEIKDTMERIITDGQKLTHYRLKSGKIVKVKDMFATAMLHDKNVIPYGSDDAASGAVPASGGKVSGTPNLTEQLQNTMQTIDDKLKSLETETEKARASLRELSKLYSNPAQDESQPPTHKYTLRGISISKYVTYVRRRNQPDLMNMGDTEPELDQWWHIEYSTTATQPVIVKKVTENEVLTAVYRGSKNCIVIYASEKAMEELPPQGLPPPLETFVRADNLSLEGELSANTLEAGYGQDEIMSPRSPPKRKFDDGNEGWGTLAGPPPGPPPGYNEVVSPRDDPWGAFPSPPKYSGGDGSNAQVDEKSALKGAGQEGPQEMEMWTKEAMPRFLPSMSQGTQQVKEDAMDVDQLSTTKVDNS